MLHRVVREHKATLFAQAESRSASGRGYPRHVRDEFDKYERCGILAYGLIRARCQTCGDEQVVGFSCKRKTLCCSCAGRRMAEVTLCSQDHTHSPSHKRPVRIDGYGCDQRDYIAH